MLQERIEGKWLAAFRRVFALNGIGKGTKLAILSETQSRPVLIQLCELAAYDLGAEFCMIQMPTPVQTAPVPVKSTGTSWAIQGNRSVIEALKLQDIIVDCTVEGLIHAPEWPEIEEAGRTRLLVITNEHPEILERTEPKAEHAARVTLGKGAVIGGNVWVTHDVPAGGHVTQASAQASGRFPSILAEVAL